MLINNEGIPLETTMDHDTTVQVGGKHENDTNNILLFTAPHFFL